MQKFSLLASLVVALLFIVSCSPKRYALNSVGDMLAQGGSVYESDEDIELVGGALPFSLKLIESLLAESPDQSGLLLAASRGFVLYAYAYVHWEAEQIKLTDLDKAHALEDRAVKLYLRGLHHGLHGLSLTTPKFEETLSKAPLQAVQEISSTTAEKDVPFLYWSAAALGLAISASKSEPEMLARLPEVEAMLDRALELDESWNRGTLHEFKILWAAAQRVPADQTALQFHFDRALALSEGHRASLFVSMAEAVSIGKQDREEFTALLEAALAVDPEKDPDQRLLNAIAQRRAEWLLGRIDELIL